MFGDYYELGISHFLIRGFDPLIDAIEYGRELNSADAKTHCRTPVGAWGGRAMIRLALAAGLLLGFAIPASAQSTLRVGDQKGNSQAVMEAAGVLKDVPYKIMPTAPTRGSSSLRHKNGAGYHRHPLA